MRDIFIRVILSFVFLAVATPTFAAETIGEPTVTLDQAIHFFAADGSDVVIEPGTYSVEATEEWLRVIPGERRDALLLETQSFSHQESFERPSARLIPGEEDQYFLVLLLPNGRAMEAIGSVSGIRSRAVRRAPTARVPKTRQSVSRIPSRTQKRRPLKQATQSYKRKPPRQKPARNAKQLPAARAWAKPKMITPIGKPMVAVGVPSVSRFRLNNGAPYTANRSVIFDHTLTNAGDYYRASENASYQGAVWLPYTSRPSFNLSPGNGEKRVYFQVKNTPTNKMSAVVSDTIVVQNPRVVSMSINGGAASTQSATVTLGTIIEGTANEYRASDSGANFPNTQWKPFSNAIEFALSNSWLGNKTVYLQVRGGGNVSNIVSDSISFNADTEYIVSATEAYDFARLRGFSFEGAGDPPSALASCTFEKDQTGNILFMYAGTVVSETVGTAIEIPVGVTCRFDLFKGRQLNPPWRILSVTLYTGANWQWIKRVTPESTDPSFAVHVLKLVSGPLTADLRFSEIRLLGPSGAQWHEAFE